jgi:hypothetical protein
MIYFNSQHYKIDFKRYLADISLCRRIIYLAAVFVLTSRAVLGLRAPARPGRIVSGMATTIGVDRGYDAQASSQARRRATLARWECGQDSGCAEIAAGPATPSACGRAIACFSWRRGTDRVRSVFRRRHGRLRRATRPPPQPVDGPEGRGAPSAGAARYCPGAPLGLGRASSTDCSPFSTTIERKPIPCTRQPSFSCPRRSREIASAPEP